MVLSLVLLLLLCFLWQTSRYKNRPLAELDNRDVVQDFSVDLQDELCRERERERLTHLSIGVVMSLMTVMVFSEKRKEQR